MAELERIIRRGGVYWIRVDEGWGASTTGIGRPGLVISSDFGNEHSPNVIVAFCTTSIKKHNCNVEITCTGKESQVMCNQLITVGKDRLGQKLGQASDEEMNRVDETLAMCTGLVLHNKEVDEKLEEAKKQVYGLEEELMAKRVEVAMLEKLYEKSLEMMAGLKLTRDLQTPVQQKTEPKEIRIPKFVPDEPELEPVTEEAPPAQEKVNINTAQGREISEKTGMALTTAFGISGYRKKNGNYKSVEEILNADRVTKYHLDKYGAMLEV